MHNNLPPLYDMYPQYRVPSIGGTHIILSVILFALATPDKLFCSILRYQSAAFRGSFSECEYVSPKVDADFCKAFRLYP